MIDVRCSILHRVTLNENGHFSANISTRSSIEGLHWKWLDPVKKLKIFFFFFLFADVCVIIQHRCSKRIRLAYSYKYSDYYLLYAETMMRPRCVSLVVFFLLVVVVYTRTLFLIHKVKLPWGVEEEEEKNGTQPPRSLPSPVSSILLLLSHVFLFFFFFFFLIFYYYISLLLHHKIDTVASPLISFLDSTTPFIPLVNCHSLFSQIYFLWLTWFWWVSMVRCQQFFSVEKNTMNGMVNLYTCAPAAAPLNTRKHTLCFAPSRKLSF